LVAAATVIPAVVVLLHRQNIKRLISGTERRVFESGGAT
jgi:glycerol-3-phosphate acyltransferase PlsY